MLQENYHPHRKLGITTDNETDLLLARRVKKISYEVPSTYQQQKYLHDIETGANQNRPLSPNTLSKRKPLVSFIDNFTLKQYGLVKPKRILVKDRDFLHLLGEVNGSKYNYCSRPELEILVIGLERQKYYNQVFHQEVKRDANPRGGSRPRSASVAVSNTSTRPTSAIRKSETIPEDSHLTDDAEAIPLDGPPFSDLPNFPQHIVPNRLSELSFNLLNVLPFNSPAVTFEGKRYLTLLYDPMKNLIILSEKMEIELIQLLLTCHEDNVKRKQEYDAIVNPKRASAAIETKAVTNPIVAPINAAVVTQRPSSAFGKNRLKTPRKDKKESNNKENTKTTPRKTLTRQRTNEKILDNEEKKKKGNASDSSDQEEGRSRSTSRPQTFIRTGTNTSILSEASIDPPIIKEVNETAILEAPVPVIDPVLLANITPPEKKDLILLQSFYYIGNDDIIYTLNIEKIRYWKRFYTFYLLPFFTSYLDAYSHQYSFISSTLVERMHQIDHHIELNQNKTILEDSQSEASDHHSVGSQEEKKGRKLKKQNTMHKKKGNNLIATSNGGVSEAVTGPVPSGGISSSEDEQGDTRATIIRRNNIKPIFIPKEKQSSKKHNLIKATSSSQLTNDK